MTDTTLAMIKSLFNKTLNQGSVIEGKEAEQFVYKKLSVGSLFIFQIRYISEDNFGNILTIREAESNGEMTVSLDPDQVSSLSQDEKDLIKYIYGIAF